MWAVAFTVYVRDFVLFCWNRKNILCQFWRWRDSNKIRVIIRRSSDKLNRHSVNINILHSDARSEETSASIEDSRRENWHKKSTKRFWNGSHCSDATGIPQSHGSGLKVIFFDLAISGKEPTRLPRQRLKNGNTNKSNKTKEQEIKKLTILFNLIQDRHFSYRVYVRRSIYDRILCSYPTQCLQLCV